jgi:hypothetical protein
MYGKYGSVAQPARSGRFVISGSVVESAGYRSRKQQGLSTFFHFMNGTALLGLGLSFVVGRTYRFWPGWVAIVAGTAFLAGGASTAETGFSMRSGMILQPALILLVVFLVGAFVSVRRFDGDSVFEEDARHSRATSGGRPSAASTSARQRTPAA